VLALKEAATMHAPIGLRQRGFPSFSPRGEERGKEDDHLTKEQRCIYAVFTLYLQGTIQNLPNFVKN
jgi:hypothetical protein